ncbi:phage major capsid protein [Lactobacillus mulieris]|uniref:phage major capsid protein n=1 Tax=Lactobacillus mulieris TaxID=2508708 RepID=UPI001F434B3B|nr:phage major capsid protein [Lactobacillus mulieris]MCF1784077.1 phage major capsid protein [Lactobacillus mulieris]
MPKNNDFKCDVRSINLQLASLTTRDAENGSHKITGYGMLFNQPSVPMPFIEYIKPEALDGLDLSSVMLLRSHDFDQILARVDSGTLSVRVDDKGLYFEATMPDTTLGNDTLADIKAGNIKGCSIGFNIGDDDWSRDDSGQTIHQINEISHLNEISLTPIPAYQQTSANVERSLKQFLEKGGTEMPQEVKDLKDKESGTQEPNSTDENSSEETRDDSSKKDDKKPAFDIDDLAKRVAGILSKQAKRDDEDDSSDDSDDSSADSDEEDKDKNAGKQTTRKKQKRDANPEQETRDIEGGTKMPKILNQKTDSPVAENKRDFLHYMKTGEVKRDATEGGIGLSTGQVLIPQDILAAEHDQHQFARLGNMIRTISVKHTTGKLPYFSEETGKLTKRSGEFVPSETGTAPQIKQILWDLKSFSKKYPYSIELLNDSDYNWEAELAQRCVDLKDNTDDDEIMKVLTNNITASTTGDLLASITEAIDKKLKPNDSKQSNIVLSQSAFYYLDSMKDTMGRPLVQPDVTKATDGFIKGKSVVIIDDTLFPNAKDGDVNMIITPLQKAAIKFMQNQVTGKFIDTYDEFFRILGIYMRADYQQYRGDLINWYTGNKTVTQAASTPGK